MEKSLKREEKKMKINRFIKICLLVAAAGVVIYVLGYALGGRVYGIELGQSMWIWSQGM